jgi:hypothetical protein
VAAVADDDAVESAAETAAGARPIRVTVDPPAARRSPGDLVTATVQLRSRAFAGFGQEVWVPARTTMRVEAP